MFKLIISIFLVSAMLACKSIDQVKRTENLNGVDERADLILKAANKEKLVHILSVDHSRLAYKAQAGLDASKVDFYSNIEINSELISQNILVGLDLPMRVLNYAEDDKIKTIYTDSIFLQKRHNLNKSKTLSSYSKQVSSLVKDIPNKKAVENEQLVFNYGIIKKLSDFDFETTISNIKRDVLEEGDTQWFLTLDYKEEAKTIGKQLPKSTVLVFGAPNPGAKAMRDFPSIGLDTFPQKVLVFEDDGKVYIAYNDIVALSKLHYENSALAHRFINFRLGKVLSSAVEK